MDTLRVLNCYSSSATKKNPSLIDTTQLNKQRTTSYRIVGFLKPRLSNNRGCHHLGFQQQHKHRLASPIVCAVSTETRLLLISCFVLSNAWFKFVYNVT